MFTKGSTEQVWPKSGAETTPVSKEHYCLMLLRDLEVKPSFAIHFSTQFSAVGYWESHHGYWESQRAHNELWSARMAAGWWVTKERRWSQRGLHNPNRYLCLFWPSGTESVSQHLLLLGQESTVTVPHQQRIRSQVCIAHSEHRPWYLPTSQRLTAQCLLAAETVLCLASHWNSQQADVRNDRRWNWVRER